MSQALERILDEVQSLTPEERRQLREFLELEPDASPPPRPADLVRQIQGSYAHVPTSSEAFIARKAEEIELENRRRRP